MCDFSYGIWEDAKNEGINEGRLEASKESARCFFNIGLSPKDIAKGVGFDFATVKGWLKGDVSA